MRNFVNSKNIPIFALAFATMHKMAHSYIG